MTRRNVLKGAKINLCQAVLAVAVASSLSPSVAHAQAMEIRSSFSIPAGDLASAVDAFSRQSGLQILYKPELLKGKRVDAISGSLENQEVLVRLLKGTGVQWERVDGGTIVLKQLASPRRDEPKAGAKTSSHRDRQSNAKSLGGDPATEVEDLEQIVVVGSRMVSSPVETAMPVRVITREEIDRSGASSIAQMLTYLPEMSTNHTGERDIGDGTGVGNGGNTNSTTARLRGMPAGTTLILINGRRAGDSASFSASGQFDLSSIPLSMVDRIEVLPSGASAVYGGDALSGVINVVLRRDASGTEVRFRRTHASGTDATQANWMWGKAWGRGGLTAAAEWSKNNELTSEERELTADQDFRRFGGTDYRLPMSSPATIYSLEGCVAPLYCLLTPVEGRGNLPGLDSPVATVPMDSDGVGLVPADFIATQGVVNQRSDRRQLRSAEKRYSVLVNGHYSFSPTVELFGDLSYTKRSVPARQIPLPITNGEWGLNNSRVPGDHPFNPFGVPVGVSLSLEKTGIFSEYEQKYYRGSFGIRGDLGKYRYEASAWHARDTSSVSGGVGFDAAKITAALNSKDPNTTINPFVGTGRPVASDEFLRSLLLALSHDMRSEISGFTGLVQGPLVKLPAGDLRVLIGADWQEQTVDISSIGTSLTVPQLDGSSINRALFTEARIPFMSPRRNASLEAVAATMAYRWETTDRFDDVARSGTFGLEVRPIKPLLLRAAVSTAFKPIQLYTTAQIPVENLVTITDPGRGGERYAVRRIRGGGVPTDIQPETSRTTTLGATVQTDGGWRYSLNHWDTEFKDRIAFISIDDLIRNEEIYPGRVNRDPNTGLITDVDVRQVNIALRRASGVDIAADGVFETSWGTLYPSLSATYAYEYEEQLSKNSPPLSGLAQYRSGGWTPRWKLVPRLAWDHSYGFRSMLVGRYISKYKDSVALSSGPDAEKIQSLGDFWIVDLNFDVSLGSALKRAPLSGWNLSIGATNVLNKLPEFCAGCGQYGYDTTQSDIVGRTIYAEMRISF